MSGRLAALSLLLPLALAGCGLPGELHDKADALAARMEREQATVEEKEGALEAFLASSDNSFLRKYADRETWSGNFQQARDEIARAAELYAQGVSPLLEADRSDDEAALRTEMARVAESLDLGRVAVRKPAQRAAFLKEVREDAPERVAEGARSVAAARAALAAARAEVERGAADYSAKAEDLAGRLAAVSRQAEEARVLQGAAESEIPRLGGDDEDLARLGDSALGAATAAAAVLAAEAALRGRVGELYRSYSKTLIDMKEDGKIEIGRTSWNESVDFPRESELRYTVPVDPEQLETLDAFGDKPIATISSFFGRSSLNVAVDRSLWDALGVDPMARMPRGDNAAEFWVGDSVSRYFHRYRVVEGEQSEESDWVEVDEAFFEQHYDDLGMDIVAKPYGSYEDEVLTAAAPPGLAYVGNPKYGRWETADDGRRRWSWGQNFLFYYLIFGGSRHHYYHDDWRRWNGGHRGRSAWYGSNDSYGTYGRHTRNSSKYAGGSFARGGGFRRADRSIRGAGPGSRGGGPGGGGK